MLLKQTRPVCLKRHAHTQSSTLQLASFVREWKSIRARRFLLTHACVSDRCRIKLKTFGAQWEHNYSFVFFVLFFPPVWIRRPGLNVTVCKNKQQCHVWLMFGLNIRCTLYPRIKCIQYKMRFLSVQCQFSHHVMWHLGTKRESVWMKQEGGGMRNSGRTHPRRSTRWEGVHCFRFRATPFFFFFCHHTEIWTCSYTSVLVSGHVRDITHKPTFITLDLFFSFSLSFFSSLGFERTNGQSVDLVGVCVCLQFCHFHRF